MSNGLAAQHNTLTDLQFANMGGFLQESMTIDILFWIFIILIIIYFIWSRKNRS